MKAFQLVARESLEYRDVEQPRPGPGDLLVRVRAAGLCDTDLAIYRYIEQAMALGIRPPITLGHEVAGEVAEVGTDVSDFAPGDRVVAEPNIYCGECPACAAGRQDACARVKTVGMMIPGGFGECIVQPAAFAHKLPDHVSYESAGGLIEPIACAVSGYRRVRFRAGEDVLVIGDGFFGTLFAAVARAKGAGRVVVLGHHESRLSVARARGADVALDERSDEAAGVVTALGGGFGPPVVIDTVGSSASLSLTLRYVGPGGRIGLFGVTLDEWRLQGAIYILAKGVDIFGLLGSPLVWPEAVALLADGRVNADGLVTHVLPLADLPDAFALKAGRDPSVTKIVMVP